MKEPFGRDTRFGVGFIGAGPVTQAIHLPTLARLEELFEVVAVMDVDPSIASAVAERVGAAATTSIDAILADDRVEVVVVCSPNAFHAEQVIAACRAGKRAVLCEKPLAVDAGQAAEIAAVSTQTGVPVVVGAMHTFDSGWLAGRRAWAERRPQSIRSSMVLPYNPRFEDLATQIVGRPAVQAGAGARTVDALRTDLLGLAIHDLPLIRQLLPSYGEPIVLEARQLAPMGYLVILEIGGVIVELHAVMSENWRPTWILDAIAEDAMLRVEFPPSYVQAGSAAAQLNTGSESRRFGPFAANGYESEWRAVATILDGERSAPSIQALVDDLRLALQVADDAVGFVEGAQ